MSNLKKSQSFIQKTSSFFVSAFLIIQNKIIQSNNQFVHDFQSCQIYRNNQIYQNDCAENKVKQILSIEQIQIHSKEKQIKNNEQKKQQQDQTPKVQIIQQNVLKNNNYLLPQKGKGKINPRSNKFSKLQKSIIPNVLNEQEKGYKFELRQKNLKKLQLKQKLKKLNSQLQFQKKIIQQNQTKSFQITGISNPQEFSCINYLTFKDQNSRITQKNLSHLAKDRSTYKSEIEFKARKKYLQVYNEAYSLQKNEAAIKLIERFHNQKLKKQQLYIEQMRRKQQKQMIILKRLQQKDAKQKTIKRSRIFVNSKERVSKMKVEKLQQRKKQTDGDRSDEGIKQKQKGQIQKSKEGRLANKWTSQSKQILKYTKQSQGTRKTNGIGSKDQNPSYVRIRERRLLKSDNDQAIKKSSPIISNDQTKNKIVLRNKSTDLQKQNQFQLPVTSVIPHQLNKNSLNSKKLYDQQFQPSTQQGKQFKALLKNDKQRQAIINENKQIQKEKLSAEDQILKRLQRDQKQKITKIEQQKQSALIQQQHQIKNDKDTLGQENPQLNEFV